MKILHVCLASAYTEGMTYQENFLSDQNVKDGHNVIIVSDCNKYENGSMVRTDAEDKILTNGIRLIRLEYDRIINTFISGKIRKVSALNSIIMQLSPDVILFHGVAGWEMLTVARYKRDNPKTKLYIDSHEDYNNSARNSISRIIQYKWFNRLIVKKILPYVDKVLCVSYESFLFLEELYHIPKNLLEFYPLGGVIIESSTRRKKRELVRTELGLKENDIVFMHSGKMSAEKRTKELLTAFKRVKNERFKLILVGSLPNTVAEEVNPLIEADERIRFLGWKNRGEIINYLCASDMYLQPGSQSATMQNAICCGCSVMLFPHKSHGPYLDNNGFYVKTVEDMVSVFQKIGENPEKLKEMSKASFKIAYELLDYRKLAARLYE
ncbi:glycosyltransferase family 4 protein [Bacillus sp. JJ1532]|uniref:glycosyltransferase family 4 protein n=1 Tax=Bacillus sp. JJ1532 TaxID=3122958 RepID=UPI002FFF0BC5